LKTSIYNKIVSYNGDSLIYNQVTGALLKVGSKGLGRIKSVFEGDFSDGSLVDKLINLGYLVESDSDERTVLREVYEKKSQNHLSKHMYITVTDRCNLGCHYCFEEKNQWIKMSVETQDALIQFSKKFIKETPTESFGIGWYGGEPTMHMPAIERLSRFYKDFCEENSIFFYQMIITNGTTFTDSICDKLLDLGIKKAQVTIDGFKEDHNISRPYLKDLKLEEMSGAQRNQIKKINPSLLLNVIGQEKSAPRSSYDEIISGVEKYVNKGGVVSLRMNLNEETINRVNYLLEDLYERKLFDKNEKGGYLYAYAQPIFDTGGCGNSGNGNGESNCGSCKISSMKMSSFARRIDEIKNWYKEKGVTFFDHTAEMKFTGETCTANKKYEYVINPDGTITKCTHEVGNPEKVIGSVFENNTNPDQMKVGNSYFDKFNPFDDQECYNCEVLPICMGGCKANNKVGEHKQYEAGCISTRYSLTEDIVRLYEKNK
jgi:uncharacterized protein